LTPVPARDSEHPDPRVACIAAAAAVFIASLLIAGIVGTAATAPVWVALLAAAFRPAPRDRLEIVPGEHRLSLPARF
jgi:hypothetical protein